MIKFQVENWHDVKRQMEWLWPLHWEEVANDKDKIKLDVWLDAYNDLADTGQFHVVTARDGEKIVGYHWSIVRMHLHYKDTLTSYTDVYFLHPDYREGMNGIILFKFVEESLRQRGVQKMYTASKVKLDKSAIFERLGWELAEKVYTKYIGN
jgi:hypothetical protein